MTPIDWTSDEERAFEKYKISLQSAVVLAHPLTDAPVGLMTDVCNTTRPGNKFVALYGKKHSPRQRRRRARPPSSAFLMQLLAIFSFSHAASRQLPLNVETHGRQVSQYCITVGYPDRQNYNKAVRTADDGIKIHCPDVETFRSLNKYLVDFKIQFHTYALEEEHKLKAVIRGIPTDFPVDEIQADLCGQGFPVHSVHRLCRRDGSPLWLVLAVLPRTEEAKNIFNNLNTVCGLGYPSRGPAQERRFRAVPPLPVVWPRGRQLSCGPALREMFGPTLDQRVPAYSPNPNRPKSRPVAPPRDLNNFPDLAGNKPTPPAAASRPASNPWGKPKPTLPPRAAPGPSGEAVRREPPVSLPASATAGTSSFGDDIQTVMSILRAVKSSEISEFTRDFRACSNVEEKLMVLVRYHHLMVKLESI
ncbi:hypothetical protein EVAR_89289_1 [Eumeta japonica]|uniref:Pre-C2HC domain-containing protein n=1 Tax=Eumeta variegata TaxID=151549 RepID=A0A4C1YX92_EUMVA|nr:hypothetical protein EVAR_89289_1 [Eumeta japonica]